MSMLRSAFRKHEPSAQVRAFVRKDVNAAVGQVAAIELDGMFLADKNCLCITGIYAD